MRSLRLRPARCSACTNLVLIALVVLIALSVYLKQYRGGREHYAIGSNPEAARLVGIRVDRRVMIGFLLSGAIAGLAGVLWLARFGTVMGATLGALVVLRVSPFWQQAIQGALIVAAITLDTLLARSVARRMMRKRDHG